MTLEVLDKSAPLIKFITINVCDQLTPTLLNMLSIPIGLALLALVSANSTFPSPAHQQSQLLSARNTCSKSIHCVLTRESTEGPFYVEHPLIRSSITEDRDGIPLSLEIVLVDVTTCEHAVGAMVDIWHADVPGEYSGWAQAAEGSSHESLKKRGTPFEDSRWLRGVQPSDKHGRVVFDTIIPGWYRGRATHIHVKVHVGNVTVDDGVLLGGGNMSHTGQFFFSDDLITNLSKTREPYMTRRKEMEPVLNGDDGIYVHDDGAEQVITVTRDGEGYTGKITVGIDPNANHHPGPPGHGPPGHGPHNGLPSHHPPHKDHKHDNHHIYQRPSFSPSSIFGLSLAGVAILSAIWGLRKYSKARAEQHGYFVLRQDEPSMEEVG